MNIRTVGQAIGLGNPFIYKGAFVIFAGHVLHGSPRLNLPVGLPHEMLVDDVDFCVWVQNLLYGDFSAFSMAMVGSDMALLNSTTSPLPSTPRFAEMHPLQILTIPKRTRLADRGTANNEAAQQIGRAHV